jgi:hypothetical protein
MRIIQWNDNGHRSRLPELDILRRRYLLPLSAGNTPVLRILPLSEATPFTDTTIFPVKGRKMELPSSSETVYIPAWYSYNATYKL